MSPRTCNKGDRVWRRPPVGDVDPDLLFCAGDLSTLKQIGRRLYDSLFKFESEEAQEDFTHAFLLARGLAAKNGENLNLEIDLSEAPELSRVPWEAMFLAKQKLLLGTDTWTNVIRRLESDSQDVLPPEVVPPIKLLVVVANPDSELEAGTEIGDIALRLGSLRTSTGTSYTIDTLEQATRDGFQDRIAAWKPHVVHFIGHGGFNDDQGLIYLHSGGDPKVPDPIDAETLCNMVRDWPPWLVVLNSCLSGAAAKADPFGGAAQNLIRANVPFVVAMQAPISDAAAIRFSKKFYDHLAARDAVATAVTRGRNAISTMQEKGLQAELITPVLYSTGKAERIAIRKGEPVWGKGWRLLRALDPGNARVGGIAALVSMAIALWTVIWMSGSSNSPSPAPPAPSEMSSERGMASAGSVGAAPSAYSDVAGNAIEDRAYDAASGAEMMAEREIRRFEAIREAADRDYAELRSARPIPPPPPARFAPGAVPVQRAGIRRSSRVEERARVRPRPAEASAGDTAFAAAGREPRRRIEAGPRTAARPRESYAALREQRNRQSPPPAPIEPLPPPERPRDPAAGAFLGSGIGLIPPSGPVAASPPPPSAAQTPAARSDVAERERPLNALVRRRGRGAWVGDLRSAPRSRASADQRRLERARRAPDSRSAAIATESESRRAERRAEAESRRAGWRLEAESRYAGIIGAIESGDPVLAIPPDYAWAPPPPINVGPVAFFAAASSVPISINIGRYVAILSSPAGERMTIELVGGVDRDELATLTTSAAAADMLGSARAESVAAVLREQGVASERISAASGIEWEEIAGLVPAVRRSVEARLSLRDARRILFAPGSAEPGSDGMATLDRLASFARENPQFLLLLEGHSDRSEPDESGMDRARAERVAEEIRRRGVDAARMLTRAYSHARPELVGSRGPDADRRVQITIVPVMPPVSPPLNVLPLGLPTPP